MSRETILIVLSVLVFVSPFIGLPFSVLSWMLPILGICIFIIAYQMRMRRKARRLLRESQAAAEHTV